jgi:two-component system KDP operon response regulator KdpE
MTSPNPVILVIEDEPQMLRFLRVSLGAHGYQVFEATTGSQGMVEATSRNPDVILLDLGLPDVDGLEVTCRLREWTRTPIIVISARGHDQDKVQALDQGADDYLTKPFSVDELLARIRVALRHVAESTSGSKEPVFSVGELRVDLTRREVSLGEQEIHLTPTEYRLLTTLIKYAGRVVTHRQLLKEVWGPSYVEQTQYLRVYMGQLRQKLEREPARPKYLTNEPGVGYRLKVKDFEPT